MQGMVGAMGPPAPRPPGMLPGAAAAAAAAAAAKPKKRKLVADRPAAPEKVCTCGWLGGGVGCWGLWVPLEQGRPTPLPRVPHSV